MSTRQQIFTVIIICLILAACGSGTTSVGNPTGSVITIGKLAADGKSTITIPLAVFGDSETDLTDATIDVLVNGTIKYDDLDPASYYHASSETVSFTVPDLSSGDVLTFDITVAGDTTTYEGTVSDTADAEAASTSSGDGEITPTTGGFMLYTQLSSAYEGVYVPTTGSCFRSDESDYEAFYVYENGGDVLIDFLEDQMEASSTFSNSSTSSFSSDIIEQAYADETTYLYTLSCDFDFSAGSISGNCELTNCGDGAPTVCDDNMGWSCTVAYNKCDGLDAADYFNDGTTWHMGTSSMGEIEALEACYLAN